MSSELEQIIVSDSRLLERKVMVPKLRGASNILYKQWSPTNVSRSDITFSCPTPTEHSEIDRQVQLLCPVRLSFSMEDVPAGTYLLQPNLCNLRSYPVQKGMSQINLTLNNHTMKISMGSILSAIEHFNTTTGLKNLEYSTSATYGTCQSQAFSNLPQGSRSGLAVYTDSISGIAPQSFPFTVVSQTTAVGPLPGTATAVIDFVSIESIFLSPLYWGKSEDNSHAFAGVRTMDVSFNFQPNAGFRMFAIDKNDASFPLGSGAISVTEQYSFVAADAFSYPEKEPKLLVQYLTPQQVLSRNHKSIHPYFHIDDYSSLHNTAISALASDVVSSPEISLTRMPTKIFVFARKPDSTFATDPFNPDSFAAITNLNIYWNTRSCLSTCHQSQLYNISVANGLQMDYTSWSGMGINRSIAAPSFGLAGDTSQYGGTGTIICIDPLDLGITDDMSQNPEHQLAIQVNATVKNISGESFTPQLYVLALFDGVLTIVDGVVSSFLGLTDTKIKDPIAGKDETVSRRNVGYMGNHMISLKNLFRKKK